MTRLATHALAIFVIASLASWPAAGPARLSASERNVAESASGHRHIPSASGATRDAYLRTPLRFDPRGGAIEGARAFDARGLGYAVQLSDGDATIALTRPGGGQSMLRLSLVGRHDTPRASAGRELAGRAHHLLGSNPARWRTNVRSYGEVTFHEVYRGIDLVYYGNQERLEYDFVVGPGAAADAIALQVSGANRLTLDERGDLVIATDAGTLTQRAPVLYQNVAGQRVPVSGRYLLQGADRVAFAVGPYDRSLPLVIDPVLEYATYLGGSGPERLRAVAIDAAGNIVIAGETYSPDFPVHVPAQPARGGFGDAFIAKLTPSGDALLFATYLGGGSHDSAAALDLDISGAVYVAGSTFSADFPRSGNGSGAHGGQVDSFVVKLHPDGSLAYSTLLGGTLEDEALAVDVDGSGRVHVVGSTTSADFPLVNALRQSLGGSPVFRTTDGGVAWAALGTGLRSIGVRALAVDPAAPATIYAGTELEGIFVSSDAGATWRRAGGESFGQVSSIAIAPGTPAAVLAATQSGVYRTTDGGSNWAPVLEGWATAVVAGGGPSSAIYAALSANAYPFGVFKSLDGGETWTDADLPEGVLALAVSGSTVYAGTINGVFVNTADSGWLPANEGLPPETTALAVAGGGAPLVYAGTWEGLFRTSASGTSWEPVPSLGGLPVLAVAAAASDSSTLLVSLMNGGALISSDAGETWRTAGSETTLSPALAIHPSDARTAYVGGGVSRDAFIATIAPGGDRLEFSTYLGGAHVDRATGVRADVTGTLFVVGETMSGDFPLVAAAQDTFGGLQDAFAVAVTPRGLAYATYLGGSGFESSPRIGLDGGGRAHVAGLTWSYDYPVLAALQPQHGGGYSDLFVSVLEPSGSLVRSTYLGGAGAETDWSQSLGPDVSVAGNGDTFIAGTTMSRNFPSSEDAVQPVHGGGQSDAFLVRLNPEGQIAYASYLGGSGDDYARAVATEASGGVAVAGYTSSVDFPLRNPLQPALRGEDDAFVVRLVEPAAPADTVPPVTALNLEGVAGSEGWYRSAVVVTLSARDDDDGSGVAAIHYRLNGGELRLYEGPFAVDAEGTTAIAAHAVDRAGNVEEASPVMVRIDTQPPTLNLSSPQAVEYARSRKVSVEVSAGDSGSGVVSPVGLRLDGVPFTGDVIAMWSLGPGSHVLAATVSDVAGNTSETAVTFTVVPDPNTPPVVSAGADQLIQATAECRGRVTLAATGKDADGDALAFTWSGAFGTATGATASVWLPLGQHTVSVTASDGRGGLTSDDVVITVVDTQSPTVASITATPSVIQKRNKDMVPVAIAVSATDCCGPVTSRIVAVSSNEGTSADWTITGPLSLSVRAERSGKGSGRIYTITVESKDRGGNASRGTVQVTVPH